jgi:Cd2+/Zn2+-exporting ATPase
MSCCENKSCSGNAAPTLNVGAGVTPGAAVAVFKIQKMDCPTEERLIRDRLQGFDSVEGMQFNLMERELTVQHRLPSIQPLVDAIVALGMDPAVRADSLGATPAMIEEPDEDGRRIPRRTWLMMAISGTSAIAAEIVAWASGQEHGWPVIGLALIAIATGGLDTLKKGWIALRHLSLNMNFLMSLAVMGAVAIGQWPEAAVVIFLFALAELIEALSLDRARNAIRSLMSMSPDVAIVQIDGQWQERAAKDVVLDALVRVRPGERLPLDGIVTAGQTTINQAPITGESMPVAKAPGDTVFAGTINEHGEFTYRVTAVQGESTLSRIVKSVQQAQGERAPTQRFVDRFARIYIPAVVVLAILVALVPPLAMGAAFQPWLYKALVLLVIACPCALVISTPVTVVSGLASAARHGILIKGGIYLEDGFRLKALALDKTGTVTIGRPTLIDRVAIAGDQNEMLRMAASLAARSDHPVSGAVATYWTEHHVNEPLHEVTQFEALAGRGVKGMIAGQTYYLGNHRLAHELGVGSPTLEAQLESLEKEGKTVIVLSSATSAHLVLAVADQVRPTSADAIAQLQRMGVQIVMLTGDNAHTAQAIAKEVGIARAMGGLLPQDKLDAVDELNRTYGAVGMVGDGINDAPALARADIGFAMGAAGTDTALETADVALMDDDLRKLAHFLRLSKATRRVLVQNIVLALGIKAVFLVLALAGHATLWMAVFADMGASLMVVANGMRLLNGVGIKG